MLYALLTFAANLCVGIVVAVVSAWITVRLSVRRFRSERWWERRAAAYAEAVEALHRLKRGMDYDLQALLAGAHLPVEDHMDFLDERYPDAIDAVHRVADTAPFLLSEKAVMIIGAFLEKLSQAGKSNSSEGELPYPAELLQTALNAVNKCLKELAALAKADLSVE